METQGPFGNPGTFWKPVHCAAVLVTHAAASIPLLSAREAPAYGYVCPLSGYSASTMLNVTRSTRVPSSGLSAAKSIGELVHVPEEEAGLGVKGRDTYS